MSKNSATPCPQCGSTEVRVVSTFNVHKSLDVVRRRKCSDCDYRWYTVQHPEEIISPYQLIFERPFKQNVYVKEVRL